MFHPTLHKSTRILFAPLIKFCEYLGKYHPKLLLQIRYYYVFRKKLNLKNPQDLNEKILWAKLYSDSTKWTELADKRLVRDYVEKLGLKDTLVDLYDVWYSADDINLEKLPEIFIIKANNGDGKGTNKIIRQRELTSEKKNELKEMVSEWLSRKNIGALCAEPHYKNMKPCVVVEEVLPIEPGTNTLTDYKFWCFNGKAYYVWVCTERSRNGNSAHVMTYDLEWNAHTEFSVFNSDYIRGENIPKPENFEKMVEIAECLSKGFPELRVDLYNVKGKVYFGELTFTSQGGLMGFFTPDFLKELGDKVNIEDFLQK